MQASEQGHALREGSEARPHPGEATGVAAPPDPHRTGVPADRLHIDVEALKRSIRDEIGAGPLPGLDAPGAPPPPEPWTATREGPSVSTVTPMVPLGPFRALPPCIAWVPLHMAREAVEQLLVAQHEAVKTAVPTPSPWWRRLGLWVRHPVPTLRDRLRQKVENAVTRLLGRQRVINDAALTYMQHLKCAIAELDQSTARNLRNLEILTGKYLAVLQGHEALLGTHGERLQSVAVTLGRIDGLEKAVEGLKANLLAQERRLGLLLEEVRRRLPAALDAQQLQAVADEDQHALDALYLAFEDQFRGSRAEIKDRLRVHLPTVRQAAANGPLLDIGCGRGEWLELLREEGFEARGADQNRVMIEQCRQRGLEAVEAEALTYLRQLPDACLGMVTGFHIIEHLPLPTIIALLDETTRVLKPGGAALFETPNPQNVLVGSCNFYMDPTHRNPLPSPVARFLLEARGLCRVEVLHLHPYGQHYHLAGSDLAERFNQYFYGPQDYAVIGWKA